VISQLNLFRYVDGTTVVHRADARPKVLGLTILVFVFSFSPGWWGVGIVWALGAVIFALARLPLSVLPKPPRMLLYAMAIAMFFGMVSGGDPVVGLGGLSVGLGGAIVQIRFFLVTLGLLLLALLIGWTTPAADLPRAAAWILQPLRWLRVPIDELVAALTLAVRALPLVADEFTTVTTLWRTRPRRPGLEGINGRIAEGIDVAATVTTASVRRATELGEALEYRGPMIVRHRHPKWTFADLVLFALLAGAAAGIWFSPV
jgi:energy-coupling factor transport system permease protein